MIVHRAGWLLPIVTAPVRDGWVAIEAGRIVAVGGPEQRAPADAAVVDHGEERVLLPGLVNAHTHLELSWLRGRVPPAASFDEWVAALIAVRRQSADPASPAILEDVREAIREVRASGTALVGDISNTLVTAPLAREHGLYATIFHEVFGLNHPDADDMVRQARAAVDALGLAAGGAVRASVTPHAPYSVSPALFSALAADAAVHADMPVSVHLGESPEEMELLETGGGRIRAALDRFGVWNAAWEPPRCGPIDYIERFGLLTRRLLAVHCVQLDDGALGRLAAVKATVVTCPRSNEWTGAGRPPIDRFYRSGVRVAIGTDSLASVDDLNLFEELRAVRAHARAVSARRILESATRTGAEALGFGEELGTIEPGRRAALIAVRVPPDLQDVEEYLLTGIAPADIRWAAPSSS